MIFADYDNHARAREIFRGYGEEIIALGVEREAYEIARRHRDADGLDAGLDQLVTGLQQKLQAQSLDRHSAGTFEDQD